MIYTALDDPELGYFTEDEVIGCDCEDALCSGLRIPEEESIHAYYSPCSLCGGEIPEDAIYQLCKPCEQLARGGA